VALLDEGDRDHRRCVEAAKHLIATGLTTWPVVTEAMYLLSDAPAAQDALLAKIEGGSVRLAGLDRKDVPPMRRLMQKFRELPMDFADATLVRVAEREDIHEIFTLDRRDFSVYRPARGQAFTIIP
jgi:predicted nucleic acid-binding protein